MDLVYILHILANAFDIIAVFIVVWGAIKAIFQLLRSEILHAHVVRKHHIELMRMDLGQKIVLGLEFFLVGDLIRLVGGASMEMLLKLAIIVLLRTVLSYFLTREISSTAKFHLNESKKKG